MALKQKVVAFADSTSMHGAAKVILSKSPTKRCIWLLIFLGAWSMFISQTFLVMTNYLSYPKKVSVEVVAGTYGEVPFPAVTICNMRGLDFFAEKKLGDYYEKINKNKKFTDYGKENRTRDYPEGFVGEFARIADKSLRFYKSSGRGQHGILDLKRNDIRANMEPGLWLNNTITKDELIVKCRYRGVECEEVGEFIEMEHEYYYKCFTYTPKEINLLEKPANGLSLTLMTGSGMLFKEEQRVESIRYIPGMYELNNPVSGSEGVRVNIHPPGSDPNPVGGGLDVPPGHMVSLGIKPKRTIRVGPPHGDCFHKNPYYSDVFVDNSSTNIPYRQIDCEAMCKHRDVMEKCNCAHAGASKLPFVECSGVKMFYDRTIKNYSSKACDVYNDDGSFLRTLPRCTAFQTHCNDTEKRCEKIRLEAMKRRMREYDCIEKIEEEEERRRHTCSQVCPVPCDEYNYDVTYSLSKWPAKGSEADAVYWDIFRISKYGERFASNADKYEFYNKYWKNERKKVLSDFVRVNVFVLDNQILRTEESPLYTPTQLISEIGGQFGIWIGVSVITLSELCELLVAAMIGCCSRRRRKINEDAGGEHPSVIENQIGDEQLEPTEKVEEIQSLIEQLTTLNKDDERTLMAALLPSLKQILAGKKSEFEEALSKKRNNSI